MACRRSRIRWPRHDPFIAALRDLLPEMLTAARRASPIPVDQARLLSPSPTRAKIIAAPVNYKKHLEKALADKGSTTATW